MKRRIKPKQQELTHQEFVMGKPTTLRPEHNFSLKREEWERAVLENAAYYTTTRFLGNRQWDTSTWATLEEAIGYAKQYPRTLIYAVTASGRAVLVPEEVRREHERRNS